MTPYAVQGPLLREQLRSAGVTLATTEQVADHTDLRPLSGAVEGAEVVAIGVSERFGRELVDLRTRLAAWLVAEHGFRTIVLEEDHAVAATVDRDLADPSISTVSLVRRLWRGGHTSQAVAMLDMIRSWNREHPADRVRVAGNDDRAASGPRPHPADTTLADRTLQIAADSTVGTVVLGGLAHCAVAADSTFSYPPSTTVRGDNAGAALRRRLGTRFRSVGIMFDRGQGLHRYPSPPPSFVEAALAGHRRPATAVTPAALVEPTARRWATATTTTRLIGPTYDPGNDAAYHLGGAAVTDWFDLVVHRDTITPVDVLEEPS